MSSLIRKVIMAMQAGVNRLPSSLPALLLGMNVILCPVMARADIVADRTAPSAQQPTVLPAGNGVPLVNIRTPSAAGVSRNTYSEFNVDQQGVILNNGRTDSNTQLGGWVQANPWLATGSARVILNEVNASDPSRLNGFVEVAGSRAQVVIANPAGISCEGCGFINANRATLSTGRPILNNGALQGYDVEQGTISIGGAGLDNSAGYTDLIAHAVEVNAGIWSQGVAVAGGGGTVDADVRNVNDNGSTAPTVAIDVAHLGGMYANSIRLIGNSAGVGVRNAGQIGLGVGEVTLTADGRIENTGVINGGDTRLQADTIDNNGSGRIYGDHVAVGASVVNNVGNGSNAPVIAAREQLDIGATDIQNREHALLYSAGDMAIGGALDAAGNVTGRADTLHNASATIETAGNLSLSANRILNSDEHLQVEEVLVDTRTMHEYRGGGSPNYYDADDVRFIRRDKARDLRTPDGGTHRVYYEYNYTRNTYETQVLNADPAKITAAGNIQLDSDALHNDNSHVIAGGTISGSVDSIVNQSVEFHHIDEDRGRQTRYRRVEEDSAAGTKSHWEQRTSSSSYARTTDVIDPDRSLAQQQSGAQVVGTVLPDSSLYTVNPDAPKGYLIESDPQFIDYRQWISSDYMLQQLALDPALTQMRLGDGFYEQQLIREQMAQLTGRRFLDNHSDDEAQYIALMDAGVTFAQEHSLRPGIALSAEQIAQLTSDIVWLVEEPRTLADGTVEHVLVPRLYVMVRADGIDTKGALIAADQISLDMQGDLENRGTMAGHRLTAITAENIDNLKGTLQGQDVNLDARQNLNNIGGTLRAQDSLQLSAGNDINVISTTRTHQNAQGENTSIDRIAGLYVSSGSLLANAGNNINFTGAAIVNDTLVLDADRLGNTALTAGNDFILNSVQEKETQRVVWGDGGALVVDSQAITGTRISTAGDVLIQAGNDVQGIAAQIDSRQGNVDLSAGRDLHLEAGQNHYSEQGNAHNFRSETARLQHQQIEISSAADINLQAGRNLELIGNTLEAGGDIHVSVAGDTTISAVVDTDYHYEMFKTDRSYGRSEKTVDEVLASQVVGGALASGGDLLINSHKNSQGNIVTEPSGNITLTGAQLHSGNDIAISADSDVNISAIQYNTLDFHQAQKSGTGGLSKSDEGSADVETRLHNAQLTSGGDTHVLSGNNISLIAADVTANGNINLEAIDQLLIAAGQVLTSTEQWQNESTAFSGGNLYEMREHREGETVSGAQASTLIAGGTVTALAGTGRVVGSDIHGDQGVDLQADAGDFTVDAAQITRSSFVYDKEISVNLGESLLSRPDEMITTKDGRLTVRLADAHYAESDTQASSTSMRGSQISSNADIDIAATAGSVAIIGSDLAADADGDGSGDINLSAAQKIDITEATDTASTQSRSTTGDAEVSLVVQNQAVEVVKAYERLEDAKEQLEESKRQYKDYERNLDQLENQLKLLERDIADGKPGVNHADLVELRGLVEDVKDDEEWYVAGIALAALNLTSATTALMQQTATAAASTATYGFNAGLQLDIDASKTKSEQQSTTAVASTLSGQNIRLQTGTQNESSALDTQNTQTNIQGSQLLASNNIAITTGDLNVTASRNTAANSTETEHGHVTAQMTVYGAAGGASVNASFDRSKNNAKDTTYNNSYLLSDSIDLNTSGDTTLRGATVRAESELNADIGSNLIVESVQDRSSSRNTSAGISGGYSLGGDGALSGVNAGANSVNGMSNTRQTVLTSLTSGGSANINVQNHTQITGALVGTTDANDNDLNQMNLSTDTIGFADLRDMNVSSQTSAGLSTNVGIGPAPATPGQPNTAQNNSGSELLPGTSNLTYNNSQQNSASKQLATLGHGTISVGGTVLEQNGELTEAGAAADSALTSLNRDTTDTTKELWNSDYSQEVDATLDHRLLTEDGRNQIKEDAKRTEILGESILNLAASSVSLLGMGDGETNLREHIQNKQDFFTATKHFANEPANKEFINIITSGNGTPAEKDAAYTALANSIALQLGIDPVKAMTLVQEHYHLNTLPYEGTNIAQIIQGAYAPDPNNATTGRQNGLIFLVDDNIGNTADAVRILGHETSHHMDASRNPDAIASPVYHDNRENYANIMGDATVDYANFSFAANGYSALGAVNTRNGSTLQNPTIAANNAQFNLLDPNTVEYRQLAIPEIQYVRDQDRIERFADYLKTTTGEELTTQQAQARLLQGSAGLMDAQWQEVYGTDATVMDFLMTEVAQDIKSIQGGYSPEHSDALLQQQLMNSDLAYTDPRTGERRLVFAQGPDEFSDERNGIVAFMSSDTIGLIDELGVPKHPQQRMLDTLAGRTQGQSDAFANTGGTLVDMVTGTISGMWNFVTSPIDSVRESWNAMKEFDAQGNLLGFQGRDYERGYIQGQGDGNAAIGAVGGEALAAFGGALFQGALARANGGNVTVNADANGQATGFSIQEGGLPSSREQSLPQSGYLDQGSAIRTSNNGPDNNLGNNVDNTPTALPSPTHNVPIGYTVKVNQNGTATITGPRGGEYQSTGFYDQSGSPIYKSSSGEYVTLNESRTVVSAPPDYSSIPIHHICTNKCNVGQNGKEPWTPKYQEFFEGAGLDINKATENLVALPGHRGPHPEAYHQYVFGSLEDATRGLIPNTPAYKSAVENTLNQIKQEALVPGSIVNDWLTGR